MPTDYRVDRVHKGDGNDYEIVPEIAPLFKETKDYVIGESVVHLGHAYRFKANHTAGAFNIAEVDEFIVGNELRDLKEDLNDKANIDGSYEDLVSGGAYQIISNMEEVDNTPYGYRTAGGSLEIGDREKLKKIVGGSLAVNQLTKPINSQITDRGVLVTPNSDGSVTLSQTSTEAGSINSFKNIDCIANHKYLIIPYGLISGLSVYTSIGGNLATSNAIIRSATATERKDSTLRTDNGVTYSNTKVYINTFDLTQMFGTTIADYVYSLETATAGAGVEWLKAHFPRIFDAGYIPYNAGTLEHVSGLSAHKMVGFNQCNDSIHSGHYWDAGTLETNRGASVAAIDSKIRAIPNTQYCVYIPDGANGATLTVYLSQWDANGSYIGVQSNTIGADNLHVFTTAANVAEIAVSFYRSGGATTGERICINLHWDGERDGEYEPYEEHSYPLDSDVTLRGIYKLDANNNLYADGDEYSADGTVTRKYGVVDLGTLNWSYQAGVDTQLGRFNTQGLASVITRQQSVVGRTVYTEMLCPKYMGNSDPVYARTIDMVMCSVNSNGYVYITDSHYTDAATFKAAMSGVMLVYELATPTTEEADPYTEIQNVSNWGTEEFVTTSLVPVGHETAYQPDLRAKIEVAPESPDTDGYYLMKRENGENAYVAYLGELPSDPTTDGTYTLKCTVTSGTATKTWEADE